MARNNVQIPIHLDPNNIIFTLFSSEDIKKLSVIKISTALTFDTLGYPLPGGLYDNNLGPLTEKSGPCGTCFKTYLNCPGHFGYIDLPLPVVNPLFHKILGTLLKTTCTSCHRMQIPDYMKQLLATQMRLLDNGLMTEAIQIQMCISELSNNQEDNREACEKILEELKGVEESAEKAIESESYVKASSNKNLETLRIAFITNLIQEIKSSKKCMHCKKAWTKVSTFKNRIMTTIHITEDDETLGKVRERVESKHMSVEESRKFMRMLWKNDKDLLKQIIPVLCGVKCDHPTDILFMDLVAVPPCNVRPVSVVDGRVSEHPQTATFKSILGNAMLLRAIIRVIQEREATTSLPKEIKDVYDVCTGKTPVEKLHNAWQTLQADVDSLLDLSSISLNGGQGLKQLIEKKEGIIRMHMMGKRVNFAARSVITPDPNLSVDEIGLPEEFAKVLTYPVPVTTWNVEELRKLILNGPKVHPGANLVEYEDGRVLKINPANKTQQESILKCLLMPDDKEKGFKGVKRVHRHVINGDVMLLNRQPTLHKPSIMAHTARILKGEKTLRLHYANCKAYNADFDGDEMNAHLPQNELARSEGYFLANVCNQYLVPKDGTPLSGLIQDHMVSGVKLSTRGQFFRRDDYQQLVYQALSTQTREIKILPPAIIKPEQLWSGKQVLSTVIINIIPPGCAPINLTATAKINAKAWVTHPPRRWKAGGTAFKNANEMTEAQVIIRNGELLVGVLDKMHYGATPYGLVHCMYELYGGNYATKFLSALAKLFMHFLQYEGFTLGVHDILVLEQADKKRSQIVKKSREIGNRTVAVALDLAADSPIDVIYAKLQEASANDPKLRVTLDRAYKQNLDSFTNDINKTCLPAGLLCKFPHNNLQLMVQSGAKGSTVNTMQISCLLGQIELEGKRPPVMISGKSLPSFSVTDLSPRAGGFIDGRFMTGIRPQEFFFHCMAGREGLIDTAVKTSRSGYLQRCLIKHLEGLSVAYDQTVRDSDGSVIQFYYGEDGMDISKVQFLNEKQMAFLADNSKVIVNEQIVKQLKDVENYDKMAKHNKKLKRWKTKYGDPLRRERISPFSVFSGMVKHKLGQFNSQEIDPKTGRDQQTKTLCDLWRSSDDDIKQDFMQKCNRCPSPTNALYQPDHFFGSLNDRLADILDRQSAVHDSTFQDMLKLKAMQGLCAPGEPVGLLAAQSIGEPSTQMTLNTFHFAGRGDMNVTLGIPRLREVLMMASKQIKTPSMEIPFLPVDNMELKAEKLRKMLTRVVVANVLEKIDVRVNLNLQPLRQYSYVLKFHFLPRDLYKKEYNVTPRFILNHMTKKFFAQMFSAIKKYAKVSASMVSMDEKKGSKKADDADKDLDKVDDEAGDSSEEEPEDSEDAKLNRKFDSKVDSGERQDDDERASSDEDQQEDDDVRENSGARVKKESARRRDDYEDKEALSADEEEEEKDADGDDISITQAYKFAQDYSFDRKHYLWCQLTFALPVQFKQIDLNTVLKEVAGKSVLWETPLIRRAITYMKQDRLMLRTDGINMGEMFKHYKLLDVNKMHCNDIHKVVETYGVEAATKVIVKEVQDVFNVYGITVDPRHLLLIADYMTFDGTFRPLSRKGIESNPSPFQQMSFESSLTFLKAAIIRGKADALHSPSSCLMIGKPCKTGTGCFSLLENLQGVGA